MPQILKSKPQFLAEMLADNDKCKWCSEKYKCSGSDNPYVCSTAIQDWLSEKAEPILDEDEEIFCRWALLFGFMWLARTSSGYLFAATKKLKAQNAPFVLVGDFMQVPKVYKFDFVVAGAKTPTYIPSLPFER